MDSRLTIDQVKRTMYAVQVDGQGGPARFHAWELRMRVDGKIPNPTIEGVRIEYIMDSPYNYTADQILAEAEKVDRNE